MAFPNETKDRIINIRASSREIDLIDRAAVARHKSRSDFMLEAATRAADEVMYEGNVFTIPADEWDAYLESIASPPEPTRALRDLLHDTPPWE